MKKETLKQLLIALLIVLVLIGGYLLSVKYLDDGVRKPQYERYDQSNRLEKIRKGMQKK